MMPSRSMMDCRSPRIFFHGSGSMKGRVELKVACDPNANRITDFWRLPPRRFISLAMFPIAHSTSDSFNEDFIMMTWAPFDIP